MFMRKRQLESAAAHLSQAIRFKTIPASQPTKWDFAPFDAFIQYLETAYPLCHHRMETTRAGGYGLIYHLKGINRDALPLLLLAHYDVSPVSSQSLERWRFDPFSGSQAEDCIWGRGALTDKAALISIFEALETILEKGQQPERDLYLAVGYDAALGGQLSAPRIARFFTEQHLHFQCILDEGGLYLTDFFKNCANPMAFVGVGAKGRAEIKMTLPLTGGSASLGDLSGCTTGDFFDLMNRIARRPMASRLTDTTLEMVRIIAPFYPQPAAALLSQPQLVPALLLRELAKDPLTRSMIRTTIIPAVTQCGYDSGALPDCASAIFACRSLPGETAETICAHLRKLAGDLPVTLEVLSKQAPSLIGDLGSAPGDYLSTCIEIDFPNTVIAPYLSLEGSDISPFEALCDQIFQFTPIPLSRSALSSIRGIDEHIAVEKLGDAIDFYTNFVMDYH
jgi:carboxypeptidase PM20D1